MAEVIAFGPERTDEELRAIHELACWADLWEDRPDDARERLGRVTRTRTLEWKASALPLLERLGEDRKVKNLRRRIREESLTPGGHP